MPAQVRADSWFTKFKRLDERMQDVATWNHGWSLVIRTVATWLQTLLLLLAYLCSCVEAYSLAGKEYGSAVRVQVSLFGEMLHLHLLHILCYTFCDKRPKLITV